MLNDVNLSDIRSFVLIAQLGNFTKAAEALNVSRSHVSRQISALEAQIGVSLLTRTTRSLKLTYAGERFYKQCETALMQVEQALIAAIDDTENVQGHIRVNSVGGPLGEDVVADYIAKFMQQNKHITVELDFSSPRIDLIEDHFDVAFRMGELADANFIGKHLRDIEMVTLTSPEYIAAYGEPEHPKDLLAHRILRGSVTRWSYQNITSDEKQEVAVTAHLVCKNGRALIAGAVAGNGIIRVPMMYCRQEIEQGLLVPVMEQWQITPVPFYAIYHRDKYQPKRQQAFIQFMQDQFTRN
ncbi:LysR family transcriptional regulator [Vibrio hippocampi]|uniref:HTH-type transcriptional regulator DmlR n=1 Tax=Vibrio hippocampi TaxID=654686 RepID=A0ABN8DHZ9_9VIBR|nr:LysR family transcriptional regulator [Vibrio hippocampi]CAH0527407.1 HTH-type transcriptional regulator DmlR [Vibrio hippocampi]